VEKSSVVSSVPLGELYLFFWMENDRHALILGKNFIIELHVLKELIDYLLDQLFQKPDKRLSEKTVFR